MAQSDYWTPRASQISKIYISTLWSIYIYEELVVNSPPPPPPHVVYISDEVFLPWNLFTHRFDARHMGFKNEDKCHIIKSRKKIFFAAPRVSHLYSFRATAGHTFAVAGDRAIQWLSIFTSIWMIEYFKYMIWISAIIMLY